MMNHEGIDRRGIMGLDDLQKESVRTWVGEGLGLSDLQKKITEEFGVAMTYMDVRFLVLDMGLDIQDQASGFTQVKEVAMDEPPGGGPSAMNSGTGEVSVDVDRVVKPGSVVSGTVTFSDGVHATWMLDQLGRLALDAGQPDYSPAPEDIQAFQEQLRNVLSKRGF